MQVDRADQRRQNALIDFVIEGGNLFILGQTGIKNQYNLSNDSIPFLEVNQLSKFPKEKLVKSFGKGKIVFIPLEIPSHKFLTIMEKKGDVTTFGSSMVDIFTDVPEAYTRNKIHPELKKILQDLADEVKGMFSDRLTLLKNNLSFVELTTMRNDRKYLLVHLVNYNVTVAGDISPAKDILTQIFIPDGLKVRKVLYNGQLGEQFELQYELKNLDGHNLAEITFPELNIYGLAKIELE